MRNRILFLSIVIALAGCTPPPDSVPLSSASPEIPAISLPDTAEPSQEASSMPFASPDPVFERPAKIGVDSDGICREMYDIAEQCRETAAGFSRAETLDGPVFSVSEEEKYALLSQIGAMGYCTADPGMDMWNPEALRTFYAAFEAGDQAEAGIYTFSGQLNRITFVCRDGTVYASNTGITWDDDMRPVIRWSDEMYEMKVFTMTPKGYLFYGSGRNSSLHVRTVSGLRVEPLGNECRRIQREYIDPLVSYGATGVFSLDWDADTLEKLHLNDVFEFLYQKEYGASPDTVFLDGFFPESLYPKAIPADVFEAIITGHFPITSEALRQVAVYDAERQVYACMSMMHPDDSPGWEVVDFTRSDDGLLTVTMDAVSPENLMDCSARNVVTIQLRENGSFQYTSNRLTRFDEGIHSRVPAFREYSPRV